MRVDVQKLLFVGTQSSLDRFLHAMQALGKVQFVSKPKQIGDLMGPDFYDVTRAIKILAHYAQSEAYPLQAGEEAPPSLFIRNPFTFSSEVIKMRDEVEHLSFELKISADQLQTVHQFGTIPWSDIEAIESKSSLQFRFFEGSTSRAFAHTVPELLLIADTGERQFFVSTMLQSASLPSGLREINREELKDLFERRKKMAERLESLEQELKRKSHHIKSLKEALIHEINKSRLNEAKEARQDEVDNKLFILTGWSPENAIQDVEARAAEYGIIVEKIRPEADETIPTYLENKGWSRIGEDLVHIYDTPSNSDKDPSWWVLGFFALFFAIIIGDAGYGLVFLLTALYVQKKGTASALKKRVVRLVTLLGASCVAWGLLCHSFFAIPLSEDNPIRASSLMTKVIEKRARYHMGRGSHDPEMESWIKSHGGNAPKDLKDFLYTPSADTESVVASRFSDNVLFEIALFIGCFHIILGMIRYLGKNPAHLGWITFVIGGYLYFPHYLEVTSLIHYIFHVDPAYGAEIGLQLMALGSGLAVLYSIFKNGLSGIFECMTAVQIFADALSYLRLYALGLAGALVGGIINDAAQSLPFIVAVFLVILSHAVNLVLSTMGGVIHGLRLNFLEWYHYSFEGGGKRFTPLALEKTE